MGSAKVTVVRRYQGTAPEPPPWDELLRLFRDLWGPEVDDLPVFPRVINGVRASWEEEDAAQHDAGTLAELGEAYVGELTRSISVSGGIDDRPNIRFLYWPAASVRAGAPSRAAASVAVEAGDTATAEGLVERVSEVFPNVEATLFVSYSGRKDRELAEELAEVLRPRVPSHVTVFVAPRGIAPGTGPQRALEQALAAAPVIVPICSTRSKPSQWLAWESAVVDTHQGRVLPILVDMHAKTFGGPILLWAQGKEGWVREELEEALRDAVSAVGGSWKSLSDDEWGALAGRLPGPR